uniref:Doublecortin domain-containing protein n=1 Tax=Poecilia reticulata TaxID=8081 RepID=A0A3P9NJF2_POERE
FWNKGSSQPTPTVWVKHLADRVCFYKSGDPQFSGLRVVINNRTFKTFDALLDSLSKKVPLPFGVRNITTPRGIHGINTLDELEDGKSYICSDTRKVKPIDLALARRRLPPWYHARPVSSRRRTARFFPGRKNIHGDGIRTPKKLVVFRNGDPSFWHVVLLHKKTTPNYESILGHISELMQFHVSKLHTPDGRRVRIDGLPGLILCSGSVVAVGREPFRPAVYGANKSPSPTRRPTKQRAYKRQRTSVCKTIVDSGSDRILESLAETEEETCLSNGNGEEGQDSVLPSDDNIEKSFRVNQDGSMTVEMKVRLTIKEEETVQWTTTLTRSVAADQADVACLPDPEQEVCSNPSQTSATSTDIIYKDRTREDNDDDPPSLGNGAVSDTFQEEDDNKDHNGSLPLSRRVPTPGCKKISKLRTSVESIKSVTVDEIEEGKIGSYIFSEETENRTTEQFYMENQNRTKPVPKPRRHGSVDVNSRDVSAFKSTEIMQTDSSGEEVTEAVLHIYEQQTYHDNFLANVGVHGMSASGATSETRQLCSSNEFEPSPSPAFEPVSTYRTDSRSVTSDLHLASLKPGAVQGAKTETLQQFTKSHNKPGEKEVRKDQRVFSKPKLVGKHVRLVMTPGKRQRKSSTKAAEKHKTVKPFSSAVFIKKIYGAKTKTTKHIKRRATPTWNNLPKPNAKNVHFQLSLKEKNKQMLFNTQTETSHPQKELSKNEYLNINKGVPLQSFYPSSSIAKEYVENWLEKAHSNPSSNQDKESQTAGGFTALQTQKKVGTFSEETSETSKIFELSSPENVISPSVKLRVQSFENKSVPAEEKIRVTAKNSDNHTAHANGENYNSLSQKDAQATPLLNGICSEILPPRTETEEDMATLIGTLSMELPPPPPDLLNADDFTNNAISITSSPMSSQRSHNYSLSSSPTSDEVISPDDTTLEKSSSQSKNQQGAELSRTPSIKRAPLISNRSLEKQMFLRKATVDKHASHNNGNEESKALSTPISSTGNEICTTGTTQQVEVTSEETKQPILEVGTPSFCTSVSPLSLTSDGRMSSSSVVSSETSAVGNIPFHITKLETQSPKSLMKTAKLKSSPSPERKFHTKKSSELQNTSPKLSPMTRRLLDKQVLSDKGPQKPEAPNARPLTERKHHETKALQRTSPWSKSLDMASPPGRQKLSKKPLPSNLSVDSPSEPNKGKPKKTSSQIESHQTAQMEADNSDDVKVSAGDQDISVIPELNMKPVLEKICYSIKSIRQMTKNKRPSCLEKSNSLPDFSSHVASTFGSSSNVLLAFLAVMTLKEGLTNLHMSELNANNVSCAEALKMIDSLKEIANIEDSQRLRTSLLDLQQSASMQLLQSWRGFQELGDRSKTRSVTPHTSEAGLGTTVVSELDCGIGENVINEIIENLDIPQKLKEELVSLSEGAEDDGGHGGSIPSATPRLFADQSNHEDTQNISNKECVAQDDKQNADVRSNVTIITNINQPKQPEMDRTEVLSEAAKYKPLGQATEDNGCQDWSNSVSNTKNIPQEKHICRTTSPNLQSCKYVASKGNLERHEQHQQAYTSEKSTQEREKNSGDVCSEKKPVNQELYMDCRQLTQSKNNLETDLTQNAKSAPDEETQTIPSANQDYCEQGTEKRAEVTHPGIKQEISACSNLGNLPVEKQPSSNYYVEVDVKGNKAILNTGGEKLQEEDSTETKSTVLQGQMCSMGLSLSTDDSIGSSDVEETCSEEEQPEVDCKKLQVIVEESLSGNEEEEEEPLPKFAEQTKKGRELEALTEEPEEDQVSSEDEAQYTEEAERQISPGGGSIDLLENSDVCSKNEDSSLIISESLEKIFRFNVDDSGNDDSTFEEHVDEVQPNDEDKQKRSLVEENLSYYEQECSSEEEQASKVGTFKESYAQNQEIPLRAQLEESNEEAVVESPKQQSEEVTTQSVAERVTLLEKQVAEAQKSQLAPKSSTIRHFSQRKSAPESEDFPSESTTSELALCTRSAPQSSLSFSYDSSGVITTEPEGSRVRSIREMFLARTGKDIQQRGFLSPSVSELRGETSDSGGYQSQTSSDLSGAEDDSAQKSISKGFVRRAIEMLYGKKDLEPEEASERPLSEPDQTKREPSSIFSPFQAARSKAMSELSYFNSSTALDIFSEATKCIAFNAQVGPGDSVPIDNGRWLRGENTSMRKSVSDPAGINKTFTNTFHLDELHKDAEEKTPYSLFSAKPELEDETKSQPGKCTYFSLPHASESEVCQEEMSTVSKGSKTEDSDEETKDASENSKTWAERNGTLPSIGVADFKMKDNKVHPLVELPSDGEVVVVQPGKGQVVNRRIQEPDVLDLLYSFCGEHCPIL